MKFDAPLLDANINLARRESMQGAITVRPIRPCGGCGGDAAVVINGIYPRCQPCANIVVSTWNQMRLNKKGDDQ